MTKDTLYQVEQAIQALRCGQVIVLQEGDETIALQSAESSLPPQNMVQVIVTANRARTLLGTGTQYDNPMVLVGNDKLVPALAGKEPVPAEGLPEKMVTRVATSLEQTALLLAKYAELLPALVVWHELPEPTLKLSVDVLKHYPDALVNQMEIICHAPLTLKYAQDAGITVFRSGSREHYAITVGDPSATSNPIVRIHSSCFTGDLLGSLKCDCGDQLHAALEHMQETQSGIILYLMQEGRGIGLANKLRAYALQENGLDTVDANTTLGFEEDERPYGLAAHMLTLMGIDTVKLMTNNPRKMEGLKQAGINVTDRVSLVIPSHEHNDSYLGTKFSKLGHMKE